MQKQHLLKEHVLSRRNMSMAMALAEVKGKGAGIGYRSSGNQKNRMTMNRYQNLVMHMRDLNRLKELERMKIRRGFLSQMIRQNILVRGVSHFF